MSGDFLTISFCNFLIPSLVSTGPAGSLCSTLSVAASLSAFRRLRVKFWLEPRDSVSVEEEEETFSVFSVHSVILSIRFREGDLEATGLGGSGPNLNGELAGEFFWREERDCYRIVIMSELC